MKRAWLLCLVILVISVYSVSGQIINSTVQSDEFPESRFLMEFNFRDDGKGVEKLVQDSVRGKIDKVLCGGGSNKRVEEWVSLTRRFECKIGEIEHDSNDDLLARIKDGIEERLKKNDLRFNGRKESSRAFDIDYETDCTIGSVNVQGLFGEDKHYYLYLVFHESYCNKSKIIDRADP